MRMLALGLLLAVQAALADEPTRTHAYVYDLDTGRYLYTEVHEPTLAAGKVVSSVVRYVMPDGKEFGRKTIDFTGDEFVPGYRLDLTQEGYAEGIARDGGNFTLMRQRAGGTAETESIAKEGLVAADAGLVRLLRARFDALSRGETVSFRVLAPSRLSSYKFRARRIDDTTFEGKPATRVQVDMDSMLKLFAGPLLFTFGEDGRIVEFRGPTNVRNPANGKDYVVRLAFYSTPPKDAPPLPK
jgi:hypothetical protein